MSFFYSDDPVRDAERWIASQERQLARCPKCSRCGEHIQEGWEDCLYDDDGNPICEACYEEEFEEE